MQHHIIQPTMTTSSSNPIDLCESSPLSSSSAAEDHDDDNNQVCDERLHTSLNDQRRTRTTPKHIEDNAIDIVEVDDSSDASSSTESVNNGTVNNEENCTDDNNDDAKKASTATALPMKRKRKSPPLPHSTTTTSTTPTAKSTRTSSFASVVFSPSPSKNIIPPPHLRDIILVPVPANNYLGRGSGARPPSS